MKLWRPPLAQVAAAAGMVPAAPALTPPGLPEYLGVQLDGACIGHVRAERAPRLVATMRRIKAARLASDRGDPVPPHWPPLRVSTSSSGCSCATAAENAHARHTWL
jgi:hypothetical protein